MQCRCLSHGGFGREDRRHVRGTLLLGALLASKACQVVENARRAGPRRGSAQSRLGGPDRLRGPAGREPASLNGKKDSKTHGRDQGGGSPPLGYSC